MFVIEIALIIVTLAAAVLIRVRPLAARYQRVSLLCLCGVLLLAQLVSVGPHWQVIPEYAAILLLMLRLWRRRPSRLLPGIAALLSLTSLAALWILPVFSLPKPTGSYAVGTTGPVSWTDISRDMSGAPIGAGRPRELIVQIWYPVPAGFTGNAARYARFRELNLARSYESVIRTNSLRDAPVADTDGPLPVLLFGHRWGGSRTQDTFLVEELASHGYVVIAIDHPLNAARVLLGDGTLVKSDRSGALSNLESKTSAGVQATWANELALWTADDEFALDELSRLHPFSSRLDFTHIGAFGHSFGGASSLALLGLDPRVKCASTWTAGPSTRSIAAPRSPSSRCTKASPRSATRRLASKANSTVPTTSRSMPASRASAACERMSRARNTSTSPTRRCSPPFQRLSYTGPIKGERIRTITRGLVVGFFDQNLKSTNTIPSYPEVKMERSSPPR